MAVIPPFSVFHDGNSLLPAGITLSALLGFGLALIPCYYLGLIFYNVYFHPLARYPGPKSMAATRFPYMRIIISGRYPQIMKDLHDQYGDIIRIAPDELSFIESDAWKIFYGTRPGHGQKQKDARFYPPTPSHAPSIIQSSDADHTRFRRLLSHAFSDSSLRGQESIINSYIDLLMQRLREHSTAAGGTSPPLNLVSWYNFATFDIIGDLAFGEPFDCLKNSAYHDWVNLIFASIKFGSYANVSRRIPGLKYLLQYIAPKGLIEQKAWHDQLNREKVLSRLEKSNDRPDFFANILKQNGTAKGFSFDEMVSNASTLIVAGSETTATLLSGVTYLLLKNPSVLKKLQHEVRSSFVSDADINFDSCNKLEYCLAVLTEALRVYPPVPSGLPRIVDPQGDMVEGNWVPGGTVVSVAHFAAYHSASNFKDAREFVPERHLDDPRYINDKRSVMQPFSFGPRNCIGRNLAYVEMRIILARMIFNFDMELDPASDDWINQDSFILWDKPELLVKLTPRDKEAKQA